MALFGAATLSAQTLNVAVGNVTYAFPAEQMGEALNDGFGTVTVMNRTFNVNDISHIYIDNSKVSDNTVTTVYNGETATVTIAGNIAQYIDATVDGAHVSIIQSSSVGENTCGEITYSLSGESADGSFYMEGSYKSSLELNGLTLHNPSGAAIDIQNGKRIELSVKKGYVNTLTDGTGGKQKGAIVCKGHLEFKGKGELNVTGNTSHAIYAKEYVEIKNCTINILGAVKDGINCTQYFLLESGELNISGTGDDGIQTDFKDSENREDEDTGTITISDGTLNIAVTAVAAKAAKAEGDIIISGGDITMSVSGKGKWDDSKSKTKASACLGADGDIILNGGKLNLTATGSGGKGLSCDGTLTINDGDITTLTSGGVFAYVNGVEYDGYTGSTDRLNSDAKSSPKGIKADTEIVINGGNIFVTTTGMGGEGIESKGTLTINDGKINVRSYDDAINSSSHMYIKGGEVTVIATNNDGLDSNGNLYIQGGKIIALGAGSPECGIDANEEEGYTVIFTGGELLAIGGSNSTPSNSSSTQPYVSGSGSVTAGSTITLNSGDTELVSFTIPEDYKGISSGNSGWWWAPGGNRPGGQGGGILITCPGLTSGSSYTLYNGSTGSNVTATQGGSTGGNRPW